MASKPATSLRAHHPGSPWRHRPAVQSQWQMSRLVPCHAFADGMSQANMADCGSPTADHPNWRAKLADVPKRTRRSRPRVASQTSNAKASSPARRSRGSRQPADRVLAELDQMVSVLIKENRDLQRRIERLSRQATGAASAAAERGLRSIQRRISRAVDGGTTTRRRRSGAAATAAGTTRRRVTDPQVLERRRQALAKAREARAAKRARAS